PEEIAQPGHDRERATLESRERLSERLPLQQLTMRARRLDELRLLSVEGFVTSGGALILCDPLRGVSQCHRNLLDHRLDAVGEEGALRTGIAEILHRARDSSEVGDVLTDLLETETGCTLSDLPRDELRDCRDIAIFELCRVVGEQALADELQQDVIVPFEGDVDIEICSPARQTVLRHEPGT